MLSFSQNFSFYLIGRVIWCCDNGKGHWKWHSPWCAVVTTPEIAEALSHGSYLNTFGGNLICTAAGHAVLKDKLQHNAHVVGSYLKERLTALKDTYGTIRDAKGSGFMLGVGFVTDRQLKTLAKAETLDIIYCTMRKQSTKIDLFRKNSLVMASLSKGLFGIKICL